MVDAINITFREKTPLPYLALGSVETKPPWATTQGGFKSNEPVLGLCRDGLVNVEAGGDVLSHRINQQYHSRGGA